MAQRWYAVAIGSVVHNLDPRQRGFCPYRGVSAVGLAVRPSGGPVQSPRPLDPVVDSARAVGTIERTMA